MQVLLKPRYWLVIGTEWTAPSGTPMAEAAVAFVPDAVPEQMLTRQSAMVLGFAGRYGAKHVDGRVVFFSDLTRMLSRENSSWLDFSVDWEKVVEELTGPDAPFPSLALTLSQRGHAILCDASVEGMTLYTRDGSVERVTETERHDVHQALEDILVRDWPPYVQQLIDRGRISSI